MNSLETLFRWQGTLEVKNNKGESVMLNEKPLILYQRVIGDADLTVARKQALKASGNLRRELRDKGSDAHIAAIPNYNEMDNETLSRMAVLAEALELRNRATKLVEKPKQPKEPEFDAKLEAQEKYEEAVDQYAKDLEKSIQEKSVELADARLEELKNMDRDDLVEIFLSTVIDSLCRSEMLRVFNSWCTYLGTYSGKRMKSLAFSNYSGFDNASPELKHQIIDAYIGLELGGEDLKN